MRPSTDGLFSFRPLEPWAGNGGSANAVNLSTVPNRNHVLPPRFRAAGITVVTPRYRICRVVDDPLICTCGKITFGSKSESKEPICLRSKTPKASSQYWEGPTVAEPPATCAPSTGHEGWRRRVAAGVFPTIHELAEAKGLAERHIGRLN